MRGAILWMLGFAVPALAQDTDVQEYYPGEQAILDAIEAEDAATTPVETETAFPSYVAPLDSSTSIECVREQGESFFDREGSLVIDPSTFESIEDGLLPVPDVNPPVPVPETTEESSTEGR